MVGRAGRLQGLLGQGKLNLLAKLISEEHLMEFTVFSIGHHFLEAFQIKLALKVSLLRLRVFDDVGRLLLSLALRLALDLRRWEQCQGPVEKLNFE